MLWNVLLAAATYSRYTWLAETACEYIVIANNKRELGNHSERTWRRSGGGGRITYTDYIQWSKLTTERCILMLCWTADCHMPSLSPLRNHRTLIFSRSVSHGPLCVPLRPSSSITSQRNFRSNELVHQRPLSGRMGIKTGPNYFPLSNCEQFGGTLERTPYGLNKVSCHKLLVYCHMQNISYYGKSCTYALTSYTQQHTCWEACGRSCNQEYSAFCGAIILFRYS
jgi:hypothetical protein